MKTRSHPQTRPPAPPTAAQQQSEAGPKVTPQTIARANRALRWHERRRLERDRRVPRIVEDAA